MANIPNYDVHNIANENGTVHTDHRIVMEQLITELKNSIGNKGFQIPHVTTESSDSVLLNSSNSLMVFDKDLKKPKMLVDGVWKVFQFE